MSDYYKLDGKTPIKCVSHLEWCKAFETSRRRVARDEIDVCGTPVTVSTVFLGIDHGFGEGDAPILFETMVFGGPLDEEQQRYTTWDEAVQGHLDLVERVKRLVL